MMKACRKPWWPAALRFGFISSRNCHDRYSAAGRPIRCRRSQPVLAKHGMVVAQEAQAARIGVGCPAAGRQCGRCRGRDRLRLGGDLSARRQYRRRRLHGDPSRHRPPQTSRSIIARPRRRRPRKDVFLDDKGDADPAKSRDGGLGDRRAGHGRGSRARAPQIRIGPADAGATDRAGDRARARRIHRRRRSRRHARRAQSRCSHAGRRRRKFSSSDGAILSRRRQTDPDRSRQFAGSDRAAAARAASTKDRSPSSIVKARARRRRRA